ncbi:MAG: hypothetical protein RL240_3334, partial [Planctomycetota bacterium]
EVKPSEKWLVQDCLGKTAAAIERALSGHWVGRFVRHYGADSEQDCKFKPRNFI